MEKNVNVNVNVNEVVNNVKVSNVDYKFYKQGTRGFLNEGGTLVMVMVASVLVNLKEQTIVTTLKDVKDREYTREGEFFLYETTKDYENGRKIKRFIYHAGELLQKADPKRTMDCKTYVIDIDEEKNTSNIYMEVWTFDGGDATAVPANVVAVQWDEDGWHIAVGQLPDKYWESKSDVYRWNEYRIIDEDGDEFVEQGADMRLKPTPHQFEMLKALKDAFQKALDSGLAFIWDRDDSGNVKAYNTAEVTDFDWEAVAEKGGTLVRPNDVALADTGISFYDFCGCDSDFRFALKPTDRQLKQWAKDHPEDAAK